MHKNYIKAEQYLIDVAEKNGWVQNEIIEDNYEYKNGLLLVGYSDDLHINEIGHVCIDMDNLEKVFDK